MFGLLKRLIWRLQLSRFYNCYKFGGIHERHLPCRNTGICPFELSWGVVEGEEVIIVGAVLLKGIHRHGSLCIEVLYRCL